MINTCIYNTDALISKYINEYKKLNQGSFKTIYLGRPYECYVEEKQEENLTEQVEKIFNDIVKRAENNKTLSEVKIFL